MLKLRFTPSHLIFLFLISTAILAILSCAKESVDVIDCTGVTPTYSTDIKAILDNSCAISGCHDAITHEEGMNMSTYAGAADASHNASFLGSIQHKNGFEPMPKDASQLSAENVKLLTCWVQNGSPQ